MEESNSDPERVSPTTKTAAVCCGCFGGPKAAATTVHGDRSHPRRQTIYHDASEGLLRSSIADGPWIVRRQSDLIFFDAEQDELEDDEYPIITTTRAPTLSPKRPSMVQPETLLRQEDEDQEQRFAAVPPAKPALAKPKSRRFSLLRRGLEQEEDSSPVANIVERGYPGQLNREELDQCLVFYKSIQERPTAKAIVYHFSEFEEEPYTICRFLRAVKFDAGKMLERLDKGTDFWQEACNEGFYPNLEKSLGAPKPLVLQMYPELVHGNAKNGCPVAYIKMGKIDVEGMLCFTTVTQMPRFFWHNFALNTPGIFKRANEMDPNFVRFEVISVMDLQGVSRSQLDSDTLKLIQIGSNVADFFPETLHCMLIINAPSWFALAWKMIRRFIDPRTAKKIEVYSKPARAKERLLELIDVKELVTDFGGTGPSLDTLMQQGGNDNERHVVKLVQLTKQRTQKLTEWIELKEGESASISVYTRSISGAAVSVFQYTHENSNQNEPVADQVKVLRSSLPEGDDPPTPFRTEICRQIAGPGTISVHLEDLGLAGVGGRKKNQPSGHFLVAAAVRS